MLPYASAKKYFAIPVRVLKDNSIQAAMTEPTNTLAVDALSRLLKHPVRAGVAAENDIIEAFRKYYNIDEDEYRQLLGEDSTQNEEYVNISNIESLGDLVGAAADDIAVEAITTESEDKFQASDAPIIKLVNSILVKAVEDGVSDIHIEPFENSYQVRYRIDGALFKTMNLPAEIRNAMTSRVKIVSNLDITEKRIPQDGRIKMKVGAKEVDFRVSTLPTLHGESIVLRILDKKALKVDLGELGFSEEDYKKFIGAIKRPNGLILVTGPTGSGKTTTLYSALSYLNREDVKILTVEDPVEFNFKGFNQVNVNPDAGLTFARALKAFLRQDPDICMIGEIRDLETGTIATEAAMTGHLVFSTLHTNDCPGAISRLVDMGVPNYVVASSVALITAQRLLRRICPKCKAPVEQLDVDELIEAGFRMDELKDLTLYKGRGCSNCFGTGYRGRLGVFEVMEMSANMSQAVTSSAAEDQIRKIALNEGMKTLRMDALSKAKQGLTTLEEVVSETVLQKDWLPAHLIETDIQVFEHGQTVFTAGDYDTNFYKLIEGRLAVIKNDKKIDELNEPGSFFGELNGLVKGKRNVTIQSIGRSVIKIHTGENLFDTLEHNPEMHRKVTDKLVNMLNENVRVVGKRDLPDRKSLRFSVDCRTTVKGNEG